MFLKGSVGFVNRRVPIRGGLVAAEVIAVIIIEELLTRELSKSSGGVYRLILPLRVLKHFPLPRRV